MKEFVKRIALWRINLLIRVHERLKATPLEKIVRARVNLEIRIWNRLSDDADRIEPLPRQEGAGNFDL